MSHSRTEFTDEQKADIYVRDHGTCCFSGKSLWILDHGVSPTWEVDWVDHVRPSARGGRAKIENGVCASYTFNAKKRANGADNVYFFRNGSPTAAFFRYHGALSPELSAQLVRLGRLHRSDWYFNRCLFNVFLAYEYRCWKDWHGSTPKRTDNYWLKAAWKRLCLYQQKIDREGPLPMEDRGILPSAQSTDVSQMLSLRGCTSERTFLASIEDLYPAYRQNLRLFQRYWEAKGDKGRLRIITQAERNTMTSPLLLKVIRSHYAFAIASRSLPFSTIRRSARSDTALG